MCLSLDIWSQTLSNGIQSEFAQTLLPDLDHWSGTLIPKTFSFWGPCSSMDGQIWEEDALFSSLGPDELERNLLSKAKIYRDENFLHLSVLAGSQVIVSNLLRNKDYLGLAHCKDRRWFLSSNFITDSGYPELFARMESPFFCNYVYGLCWEHNRSPLWPHLLSTS